MNLDLHWFCADPSDLDDDPADTVTASANADRAAELASEARQYEWELRSRCDD